MRTVVIGFLGTQLDSSRPRERWDRWRPTLCLCQQEDLIVDRLDLIHEPRFGSLSASVSEDIRHVSPETQVVPHLMHLSDPWDFQSVFASLYDFARAYPFDLENERYLVHITTGTHVCQICLFLLTESRHLPGRLLQTSPDPRGKLPGKCTVIDLNLSRYDMIAARFAVEQQEGTTFLKSGIQTRNAAFNRMIEQIERVAVNSRAPILLMGPTGAGKSMLARRIYDLKRTRKQVDGRFVEVNCATLRGDSAMSMLFGHTKGAFTGAMQERPGLLRTADGGLLFLDEIGELGLDEQTMLLRAIEDKRFMPMGADSEVQSDFQIICGTNRDLRADCRKGRFRDDLLARINLWTYALPGLRDRPEDIEPNIDYELEQFARRNGTRVRFNAEARRAYIDFATSPQARWDGNFRDLNGSIQRMATLCEGRRIDRVLVDEEVRRLEHAWAADAEDSPRSLLSRYLKPEALDALDDFDAVQLAHCIKTCTASPTVSEAGRRLFAASRTQRSKTNDADRLRKYLLKWGLSFEELKT